jgi:hypothetical protein
MKRRILYIFLFVFVANTMVVSVWAKPCMFNSGSMTMQTDMIMSDEMPCHDRQGTYEQDQHHDCKSFCLCLSVFFSQVPIIYIDSLDFLNVKSTQFIINDALVDSIATPPLFRPPIFPS